MSYVGTSSLIMMARNAPYVCIARVIFIRPVFNVLFGVCPVIRWVESVHVDAINVSFILDPMWALLVLVMTA